MMPRLRPKHGLDQPRSPNEASRQSGGIILALCKGCARAFVRWDPTPSREAGGTGPGASWDCGVPTPNDSFGQNTPVGLEGLNPYLAH